MNVSARHKYRFVFLKSEAWQTVRVACLKRDGARCRVCGVRDLSNDAHHIKYPKVWSHTKVQHLVTLCRLCHDRVHEIMKENQGLTWKKIRFIAFPEGHPKKITGSQYAKRHFDKCRAAMLPVTTASVLI